MTKKIHNHKTTDGDGLICGREFKIREPIILKSNRRPKQARGRYLVAGINRTNGDPIPFKSRDRAEHHIRNIGQDLKFQTKTAS